MKRTFLHRCGTVRWRWIILLRSLMMLCGVFTFSMNASASSQCYQWAIVTNQGGWQLSANAAIDAQVAWCNASDTNANDCQGGTGVCTSSSFACTFTVNTYPVIGNFPAYQDGRYIHVHEYWRINGTAYTDYNQYNAVTWKTNPDGGCQTYISAPPPPPAQCGTCNVQAPLAHPINPASGAMFDTMTDNSHLSSTVNFNRFYNSMDTSGADISTGWRHNFTRTVVPRYSSTAYQPYVASPDNSSLYNDEATACTSGFAEIKGRISTWNNASANYVNGACAISVGTTTVATLPILYNAPPTPAPNTSVLIGYDVIRDDGQSISFVLSGSTIAPPPGISLQLTQTASGFTVTDSNDNVEQHYTNGKLLSITSRSGVVQTMHYDTFGRLNNVSDSFGHQLTFSYDVQGHLSAVTRQ